jgi:hypothetical protein
MSRAEPGLERIVSPPFRAAADRAAAATAIVRNDAPSAVADARAAVAHDPVDPDSTALLASALLLIGDNDGSAKAFRTAALFGWRNLATQIYWLEAAFQVGDFAVAADRADAVLRTHPAFGQFDQVLKPFEDNPLARSFLVEKLDGQPPWLGAYLTLNDTAPDALVNRRVSVLLDAKWAAHPLGCRPVAQFTSALLGQDRRADAERVWNLHCPERAVHGYLADADFASIGAREPFPFAWRIRRSGDVHVGAETGPGGTRDVVLQNSASTTRQVLYQALALPPGNYRLRLNLADDAAAAQRLSGSFSCNGSVILPWQPSGGDAAESRTFHVSECHRQELALWLAPGQGTVHLRSAALEKID